MNVESICVSVCNVAREAGNFIREERKTFQSSAIEYKGLNDMVSYVDKQAEKMIVASLQQLLPESGFITEEKTTNIKGPVYNWVIDPLDGTTNFVHGIPCFCVSIALMKNESIVIGIVYEINFDECFYAYENGGAFLNGNKISVSSVAELKQSLMATGFPYSNYSRMKAYMNVFNHLMHHTHGLRRLGSAAADLVYVACGRFEGFYEYGLNSWDVAAGALIVKEAGGLVTDFSGGTDFVFGKEMIASNKVIHHELLTVIADFFSAEH
jgi:myo-inositol-1(or 4)-monophosphatase